MLTAMDVPEQATDCASMSQVAFHASAALRQYFRTHLVLHVAFLKRHHTGQTASKQVRVLQQLRSRPISHRNAPSPEFGLAGVLNLDVRLDTSVGLLLKEGRVLQRAAGAARAKGVHMPEPEGDLAGRTCSGAAGGRER
jgi:hypothetical protein